MSTGLTTGEDPTQAVISDSGLNKKHLCDYVINVATGCRHGCKFCYVPSTPNIRTRPEMLAEEADVDDPQREWGSYVLYRDGLGERVREQLERKRTWTSTARGQGIVGISFATDCYMDGRAGGITRNVVDALADHEKHARILTRNPLLATQDIDVLEDAGEYVTVGSSIPSLSADHVGAIEVNAPAPQHRLRGLQELADRGIRTYVSMSPTYPTQRRADLRQLLKRIAELDPDVVFHEPINPRGANFQMTVQAARSAGYDHLANELDALRDRETWSEYAVTHLRWVQEIAADLGVPIHLWPDEQLLTHVDGPTRAWLQAWRDRQSVEDFAGRPDPDGSPPEPPARQAQLGEVSG